MLQQTVKAGETRNGARVFLMSKDLELLIDAGSGPKGIDAPPDIKVGELLAEVAALLGLSGGPWVAHDKSLNRELDNHMSLEDNGVESGHLLLLRAQTPVPGPEPLETKVRLKPAKSEPVFTPPAEPDKPLPERPRHLALVAGLIAAGALFVLGYYLGDRSGRAYGGLQGGNQASEQAAARVVALEAELKRTTAALQEKEAQIATLTVSKPDGGELTRLKESYLRLMRQLTKVEGELKQARSELESLKGESQRTAAQLQAEQTQASKHRADVERLQNELREARAQLTEAQSRGVREIKDPGATKVSPPPTGVLIWSGQMDPREEIVIDGRQVSSGRMHGNLLPGVPVMVRVVPESLAIVEAPSASNGWRKIVLRSDRRQKIVVTITWTALVR